MVQSGDLRLPLRHKACNDQRSSGSEIRGFDRASRQTADAFDHCIAAVHLDIGPHASQFICLHEAVLKNRLCKHTDALSNTHQRHELCLHIRRKTGIGPVSYTHLVILFSIILTNLCNNAVTGVLFVAITYGFAADNGMNPTVLAMLIVFCVHLAVLTPAGSPMAAILHGNREWISAGEIYKYGAIAVLATGIVLLAVGLPLASLLF